MDVSLIAASIACVSADAFAKILLDLRNEWVSGRQIKAIESVICRLKTPRQRTGVKASRRWDSLVLDL